MTHHKTILKNLTWYTSNEFVLSLFGFIFYLVLARKLGEFGLGTYSYIFSFLGLVILFQDFGISTYYLRRWSTTLDNINEDVSNILGSKILLFLIISPLLVLYIFFFDNPIKVEFTLAYIFFSLDIFRIIPVTYVISQNEFHKSFIINTLDRVPSLTLAVIFLFLGFGLKLIFTVFILSRLVSIIVGFKMTRISFTFRANFSNIWKLILLGSPLFFIGLLTTIYFRIDTVIVKYLLGMVDVGLYSASYRILETLIIIPGLMATSSLPVLTDLYKKSKTTYLSEIFCQTTKYLVIVSAFIAIFFTKYSPDILMLLFGNSFIESSQVLSILGFSCIFLFLNIPYSRYLIANHQEIFMSKLLIGIAFFNIALNLILIPYLGINGAAVTTFFSEALLFVAQKKKIGYDMSTDILLKTIVASILIYIFIKLFNLPLFVALAIYGTLYIIILIILGGIKLEDLRSIIYLNRH